MEGADGPLDVLTQLAVAMLLTVLVTIIHGTGVAATGKLFTYEEQALKRQRLASREARLMIPMALALLGLHVVEIAIFALFYLMTGEVGTVEAALYESALAYTTMGVVEESIVRWRLVAAFEGLAGFLLIAWSAAVFVTDMEQVLRRRT